MRFQSASRPRTQPFFRRSPRLELLEDRVQPGAVLLWPAWLGDPVTLAAPDDSSLQNVLSSSRERTDDTQPIAVVADMQAPEQDTEVRQVAANPVPFQTTRPANAHLSLDLLASVAARRGLQEKPFFGPAQIPDQPGRVGGATPVTVHNLHSGTQRVSDTVMELRPLQLQAIEASAQNGFSSQPTQFSVVQHFTADDLAGDHEDGDPGITAIRLWSTYVTGVTDSAVGRAVAMDGAGNSYVTGWIDDAVGVRSGFVAKQGSFGVAEYLTIFQATDVDFEYTNTEPRAIAVDGAGNAYVTGTALKIAWGDMDGFAVKLSADGSEILSGITYGWFFDDASNGIALDASGRAAVTGTRDLIPGTTNAFFGRLNATGMDWSTQPRYYQPPSGYTDLGGNAIALDSTGQNAFIAGWVVPQFQDHDVLAVRLDTETALPQYAITAGHAGEDYFYAVGVDSTEHTYYGGTFANEEGGAYGYLTKLTPAGDQALYIYAFDDTDAVYGLSMNGQEVYIAGSSPGDTLDAFVAKADGEGILTDSYFLEGDGDDIAYGVAFRNFVAVIAGVTTSSDISTDGSTLNGYADAFVAATTLFA